jgi:serine/threonine protein kinase
MQELLPEDPRQIGPYRLRARLGAGGMGRVYLGLSAGGRAVAVKVVRPELGSDPEFRARFRQEVAVAQRVSGLFTAPVIDADVDGPQPWLATAFVRGPSLAEAVAGHGALPAESVVGLAAGLAEGLSAIHAAGVVHRDLKPANVLLAEDGPRVIDFGISRAVEAGAGLTRTGLVVGSPGFMSPEQAEGAEVGPASDIFSLGAVLAFAATGQGPFGVGSTPALVYRVVHGQANLEALPPAVRVLVGRCLVKDPSLRPSAAELLAEAEAGFPATGWLPEPLTRTIAQIPTPTPWSAYTHPASQWSSSGAPAAGTRSSAAIAAAGLAAAAGGLAGAGLAGAGLSGSGLAGPTSGATGSGVGAGATGSGVGADPASMPTHAASRPGSESLLLAPPAGSGPQPPFQGPPSQSSRPGGRRPRRGLAVAVSTVAAALVGAGTAAALVLTGSGGHPHVTQTEQPAAVVQSTSVTSSGPAASSSRPVTSPSGGSPAAHSHSAAPAQVTASSAPASRRSATWSASPTTHSSPTTRKSPTAPPTTKPPTTPPPTTPPPTTPPPTTPPPTTPPPTTPPPTTPPPSTPAATSSLSG